MKRLSESIGLARSVKSAAALLFLAAASAGSQTLPADSIVAAFDDSPPAAVAFIVDTPEPFLYKGLVWRGFSVIQSNHDSLAKFARSGYARGAVSGTFAAVAAGRAFAASTVEKYGGGAFVFYGMHLTAAWKTGLEVTVEGLRGGETAFSAGLLAGTTETATLRGEWEIDMLRIRAVGGRNEDVCDAAQCHPGPELVIDDFAFSLNAEGAPDAAPPDGEMIVSGVETFQPSIEPAPSAPGETAFAEKTPFAEASPAADTALEQETPQAPAAAVSEAAALPEPAGDCRAPYFGVQVGAFGKESNARRLASALGQTYSVVRTYRRRRSDKSVLHHLVIGCAAERSGAAALRRELAAEGAAGFVVAVAADESIQPSFAPPSGATEEVAAAEKTPFAAEPAAPQQPSKPQERQPPPAAAPEPPPVSRAAPDVEAPPAAETAQLPEPAGDCHAPYFGVQVGAFGQESKARRLASALGRTYGVVRIYRRRHPDKGALHHLVVGCAEQRGGAAALRRELAAEDAAGFVVRVTADVFGEPL